MMNAIHKYPPMLGSPDDVPEGSTQWVERQSLRIKLAVDSAEQYGMGRLLPELEKALNVSPHPWTVWPEGNPCRTPDRYFQYAAGISCTSLADLIRAYHPDHPLIRRLQAAEAEDNPLAKHGTNQHTGGGSDTISSNKERGAEYLLARLARDHPDILAAYERGEYRSTRAAAIAAGIVKAPTLLDKFDRLWAKASEDEREAIRKIISK